MKLLRRAKHLQLSDIGVPQFDGRSIYFDHNRQTLLEFQVPQLTGLDLTFMQMAFPINPKEVSKITSQTVRGCVRNILPSSD